MDVEVYKRRCNCQGKFQTAKDDRDEAPRGGIEHVAEQHGREDDEIISPTSYVTTICVCAKFR